MRHDSDAAGSRLGRNSALWDLGVALSLANLCWLPLWALLLNADNWYYVHCSPHWRALAISGLGLTVATSAVWLVRAVVRRSGGRVATTIGNVVFVALVVVASNAVRFQLRWIALDSVRAAFGVAGVASVLLLCSALPVVLYRWRALLLPLAEKALVCLLPFVGVVAVRAGTLAYRSVSGNACGLELSDVSSGKHEVERTQPPYRVVWIVLDDLDYELVYGHRPPGLDLPAFDRLRRSSVFAEQAYPPASTTACSLPALIVGRGVTSAQSSGPADLRLLFDDGRTGLWSRQTTVFDRARALGIDSALVGWYHPYCRILGGRLAHCQWFQYSPNPPGNWPAGARAQFDLLINSLPGLSRLGLAQIISPRDSRFAPHWAWHVELYRQVHQELLGQLRQPTPGLVFAHYSIPHPPYLYDRAQNRFSLEIGSTYEDNLALADHTLSEIDRALNESGLADRTVLVVTSDHWHKRPAEGAQPAVEVGRPNQRVPFLVRLPRQNAGLAVYAAFRTTRTAALVLSILRAQTLTPETVAGWMRNSEGPSAD